MTVTRRRFLAVLAGSAAALASPGARAAAVRWTGHALGARVSLTLVHGDRNAAWDATRAAVTACVDEIERLEDVFSLYRPQSALCRLNRHGALDDPGADLVQALSQARAVAEWTGGAFDPTMQPLWRLHAAGPPDPAALADTLTRVGHRGLSVAPRRVALARPGMAVSL
ncbi:MAG: FAD:protein FMN transferase, partial [Rhodobacterales bacterium]|nr:FAD:protein FMN transferase [Rhodobacterales bacterium]